MQRMRACAPSEGVVSETCRFPKLQECAHFHYERVQLCPLQISLQPQDADTSLHSQHKSSADDNADVDWYTVQVTSDSECWLLQRSYDNFVKLDSQLHQCIFDRKVSQLPDLLPNLPQEQIEDTLAAYLRRFCEIIDNSLNCGPVLTWFQLDNRGHRLLVPNEESDSINTPAVAAAYSIKKYVSQARDELNLEVGDMISVIDMASPGESMWWRGKRGFQVGFFPQHCVHVIGEKLACLPNAPSALGATVSPIKPVLRKHGKLIAFFRSFILNRPSRRRLKQSGILRERVFGCDLGEHLLNSGHEIPMVLKCCAEFIESHGIVDGIYRLSGVTSNIQKLRNAFDEDRIPNLYTDDILQDIHSVASLLKMYFRELPNPLCTYQLYHSFVNAIQGSQVNSNGVQNKVDESERLLRIRETVHKLPPPHYRTLEYLMRHLARVAKHGSRTGMTSRNVAIVWAPNLLRCAELEVGGVAALQGVGVQAVVTEFLICYADLIFCDNLPNVDLSNDGPSSLSPKKSRPKSLAISTPTKLLSLEEARSKHLINKSDECNYIEVGGGPKNLPEKYHTVLELPQGFRKRGLSKRSPLGWRSFFTKSRNNSHNNLNKNTRKASTPGITTTDKSVTESDLTEIRRKLRPVKSAESLISGQSEPPNNEIDILGPLHCLNKPSGHNRSVSHDSYFDTLQASNNNSEGSLLDLSEIQLNFELEESEMRIFSEDESLVSSPRVNRDALSRKILHRARPEEYSSTTNSSNPSPKKQPRVVLSPENQSRKRSRLEDQLSDILYIDCNTPDNTICTTAMIHSFPEKSMQIEDCSDEIGPKNKSPRNSDCSVITECTEPTVTSDPGNSESYKYSNLQKGKNRISLNLESCQRIEPNIPKSLTEADVRTGSLKVPDNGSSGIPSTNLSPQTPNYKRLIADTDSSETTTPNQLSPDFSLTESPTNISYKNLNRFSGESQKYEDLTDVSDINNTATYENVVSDSNGKLTPKKSPASPSYENVLTTISITYSLNSPSKNKSFENSLTKDGNIYEDIEINSDSSEHPITFTTKVTNLDEVLAQQTKINLNSSNENSSVKDITSSVNTTLINNQNFELNSKKPKSNILSSNCNTEKTMLNNSSSAKHPIRPSSVNLNPNQNENKIFRQTQSLNNSPVITPSLSVFYQNNTENKNNMAITQPTNKILQNVDDTTAPVKQQINIYENLSCFKSQSQSNISNKPNNAFITLSNPTLSKSAVISSPTKSLPVNEKRKSCETEFNNDEDAIYQQVKYFRRSIHEINELLDKPYMLEAKESDQILNNLPETFSANDIMIMNSEQERIEVIGNNKAHNDSQLSKELKSSEGESISELSDVEIKSLDSVENNENESDVKSQNIAQNNLHIVQNEKPDIESVNIVQVKESDDIFNHQQYEEQCKVSEMLMSETDTDNVESTSEKFDSLEIKETECNLYENVSFNNMDDSKVQRDRSEKIKKDLRSNENCNIKENIVLNKIESVKLKQDLNVHNSEKCKSKSQIDNGHNVRKLTSKFESAGITDELGDKNKDVYSGRDSLPPCLRARHAKLLKNNSKTRSLDENAFMKEFGHCANDSCSTDIVLRRKSFDERSNRFSSSSKPKSLNQPKTLPDLFKRSLNFHSLHTNQNSHLQNNSVDEIKESLNKEPLSLQTNLQYSFETNKSKANSPVKNLSRHSPMDLSPSTETCSHINDSSEMNFKLSSNSISSNKSNDSFTDTNVISNLETNVSNIPQLAADSNTDSHLDNPQLNRERIEKYKEERRNFLREKYRSESFRVEKDQVLSRLKQKTKNKYEHDDPDTVKDNLEYIDVLDISNKIDTHDSFMKRLGTENNYPNEKNPNEIYIDRSTKNKKSPELRNKTIGRLSDIYSKSVLSEDSYELHTNQRFKTRDPLCSTEYDLNRKALKKNIYDRDNKINDGHVDVDVKTTWKKKSNGENKFDEKNTESLKQKYEAESKNRTDCKIINDKTELNISERGAKKRDNTESKKVENLRRRDLDKMAVVDTRTDRRHTFDNLISRERESETERNRRIGLESRLMTRSPKKEKRSPSYCIKDMTAIFESKSNQS